VVKFILAFITLYGLSFTIWGTIGILRYLSEAFHRYTSAPTRQLLALVLAPCVAFVLYEFILAPISMAAQAMVQAGDANSLLVLPNPWITYVLPGFLWVLAAILLSRITVGILHKVFSASDVLLFSVLYWFLYYYFGSIAATQLPEAGLFQNLTYFLLAITGSWYGGRYLVEHLTLIYRRDEQDSTKNTQALQARVELKDVAVLIAAYNEEKTIHLCLDALKKVVPMSNVFVGSDGSTDNTVETVKQWECNIADIQPNGGKARALQYLIDHFEICDRYKAILLMDADSEIDENYMKYALPLFDDPAVVAVAGHARPKWKPHWLPSWGNLFVAYRVRLYKVMQIFLRYAQTWKYTNVSYIIPGFSSMYRCSVIPHIDITAPGLLIEDFNMTFELQRKRCGKIAYTPKAISECEDPHSLRDYFNQVKRWNLGFWQTAKRHGFWVSFFWLSLGTFTLEVLIQSMVFLTFPFVLAWLILMPGETLTMWLPMLGIVDIRIIDLVVGIFVFDYILTILVTLHEEKPMLLIYGLGFVPIRWIDSFLFLFTLPLTYFVESDGRWASPSRK